MVESVCYVCYVFIYIIECKMFLMRVEIICLLMVVHVFFFIKQKTASEMRISDWSSDVCSSDLCVAGNTYSVVYPSAAPRFFAWSVPIPIVDCGLELFEIGRASCRERVCQYV